MDQLVSGVLLFLVLLCGVLLGWILGRGDIWKQEEGPRPFPPLLPPPSSLTRIDELDDPRVRTRLLLVMRKGGEDDNTTRT